MNITFKNGYFKVGHFEQLIIADKIYKVNEFISELLPNRNIKRKSQIILETNENGIYFNDFENNQTNNEPKKLSRKQKKIQNKSQKS